MEDLSLHILDIAENSLRAEASVIEIRIEENEKSDLLILQIKDNGKGMSKKDLNKIKDPFFTTKSGKKTGLGISLLEQSVRETNGTMKIRSAPGKGTSINAKFSLSNIDRKPLGSITSTLIALISANPDKDFILKHKRKNSTLEINTKKMKEELKEISISHPDVIKLIRNNMNDFYTVSS